MHRFIVLCLLLGACAPSGGLDSASTTSVISTSPAPSPTTTTTTSPVSSRSPLADQVVPLGSAIFDPRALAPPPSPPVAVSVDGVSVDSAPVVPVGVEDNGELEIPGAREVGWYQFGPTPRQEGSTVLAAHIAFNGRDGVFRRLASVDIGAIVTVRYADGATTTHVVTEIAQYGKADLPFDRVFSKSGPATLTLITCGGDFNRALNSYDDNIVVYAHPADR